MIDLDVGAGALRFCSVECRDAHAIVHPPSEHPTNINEWPTWLSMPSEHRANLFITSHPRVRPSVAARERGRR